jgi:hypothetical protein
MLLLGAGFCSSIVFVALWAASPAVIPWLDRPCRRMTGTAPEDLCFCAWPQTWRFLTDLVGPDTHGCPGNSQLSLNRNAQRIAYQYWPLANIGPRRARFRYLPMTCSRSANTMGSSLERYEGHLLNWYDTQERWGRAFRPHGQRQSAASLWVLEQGCQDVPCAPDQPPQGLARMRYSSRPGARSVR